MKAEIGRDGVLYVTPESTTESFALDQWAEKSKVKLHTLEVDMRLKEEEYWRGSKVRVMPLPLKLL